MNLRVIPRTALEGYIRLMRLPLDTAIALLPGNGTGPSVSASLAADRAEAAARAIAGVLLGDPVLREDAGRRRAAADERARALRLRTEAERKTEEADARLGDRQERAVEDRRQAKQRATAKRRRAEHSREETTKRAARSATKRRATNRRQSARSAEAAEERARKKRLEALDTEADALRERDEALTAADEARRLGEAAAKAKAERKSSRREELA
jgi:colicin import membrane protein